MRAETRRCGRANRGGKPDFRKPVASTNGGRQPGPRGDVLVVLESMKMEIPLLAPAMALFNRFTCSRAARYAPGSGWR